MSILTISPTASVDLQLHTIYSDGAWTPSELIPWLATHTFRVAAVTDHDTVAHLNEVQALGKQHGVHLLAATELTTSWEGLRADVLCYAGQAFTGDALATLADRTTRLQLENTHEVHRALLAQGYEFPRQADVLAHQSGALRRPIDNATLLCEHGYVDSIRAGVGLMREVGYASIAAPIEEAIAAAHASGALTLVAHPGRNGGEISQFDPDVLARLLDAVPLDGIEARYPTHSADQVAAYVDLAQRRGLLVSAGSDSHGPHQRLPIAYPAVECAALLARCGISVE